MLSQLPLSKPTNVNLVKRGRSLTTASTGVHHIMQRTLHLCSLCCLYDLGGKICLCLTLRCHKLRLSFWRFLWPRLRCINIKRSEEGEPPAWDLGVQDLWNGRSLLVKWCLSVWLQTVMLKQISAHPQRRNLSPPSVLAVPVHLQECEVCRGLHILHRSRLYS